VHKRPGLTKRGGRLAGLSPRERQVLERIVAGKPNKVIAYDLDISIRTVEVHRARLLTRLGTHSMATPFQIAVLAAPVACRPLNHRRGERHAANPCQAICGE
jgi:two-component system response regulator FixJ